MRVNFRMNVRLVAQQFKGVQRVCYYWDGLRKFAIVMASGGMIYTTKFHDNWFMRSSELRLFIT